MAEGTPGWRRFHISLGTGFLLSFFQFGRCVGYVLVVVCFTGFQWVQELFRELSPDGF